MRIVAGTLRSRRLQSLESLALRPTSDRLRETLFNILGPRVSGSRFLDLFAGTGAIGIEAISRGAVSAVFVENHSAAVRLIGRNLASLGIASAARVMRGNVAAAIARLESGSAMAFDFVFLDPPYADEKEYQKTLRALEKSPLVGERTVVVAEHRRKFELPERTGRLQRVRVVPQGDAALSFYRQIPDPG